MPSLPPTDRASPTKATVRILHEWNINNTAPPQVRLFSLTRPCLPLSMHSTSTAPARTRTRRSTSPSARFPTHLAGSA
eukprot:9168005-Prorocentrum_lima.AAC.1